MHYMIAYDIRDNRRRRQVEKALSGLGERVQYSVFECRLSREQLAALAGLLASCIDPAEDSLRYYPLCRWCEDTLSWQGRGQRVVDADAWIV